MTAEVFLDGRVTMHIGDVRAKLRELPADHFDCVVTSPPYWGLRDYGTGRWEGGDPSCDHLQVHPQNRPGRETPGGKGGSFPTSERPYKDACLKCHAKRVDNQIGLEPTLADHLMVMVEVFEEVRRVLKPTGTLWLNYGDCYATSPNGRSAAATKAAGIDDRTFRDKPFSTIGEIGGKRITAGEDRPDVNVGGWGASDASLRWRGGGILKAKDLCMIPNRLAIALQEAGWYVRSEIIWHKPNPMPESITDRPTTSHEKVWLMSKSERYVYDAEAIREPVTASTIDRLSQDVESQVGSDRANGGMKTNGRMKAVGRNSRANVDRVPRSRKLPPKDDGREDQGLRIAARFGGGAGWREEGLRDNTRNSRNVWTIPTSSFSEAHFATFPPALVERCIKAGCPSDGSVLDIFGGAGTTGLVAVQLGRTATLIELNPEYAILARARIEAAFMERAEGSRHMAKQLGKDFEPADPYTFNLFAPIQSEAAE